MNYMDNGYFYFFDTVLRMWTIYECDSFGNQLETSEYVPNRKQLIKQFNLNFNSYEENSFLYS